ncbi:MAG TPA: AgmX/PglI C-terminal domain-containing protein, partial [Anaeromyxobacter sp.]
PAVAAAPPPRAAPEPRPEAKAEPTRAERRAASRPAREPPPREPSRKEAQRVATTQPATEARSGKKGGDSILDFDSSGDSALDDALGGKSAASSKRSVYVPPARAGGGALPDRVSPGDINGAVAQRMDALRKCVSDQKAREPDLSGTLKMRWLILGDGSVRDVKCITPEFAQGQFAACLGGVVRSIRFPRSATTGQEVTFPFSF